MIVSATPFLMFEGEAEAAFRRYAEIFPAARIVEMTLNGPGESGVEGKVARARLDLAGQMLIGFDSPAPHAFGFTPSISLFLECDSADDIDRLADALMEGGGQALMPVGDYGFSRRFAWINDRFGVSWQLNFT